MTPQEALQFATHPKTRGKQVVVTITGTIDAFELESDGQTIITVAGREIELTSLWRTAGGRWADPNVTVDAVEE